MKSDDKVRYEINKKLLKEIPNHCAIRAILTRIPIVRVVLNERCHVLLDVRFLILIGLAVPSVRGMPSNVNRIVVIVLHILGVICIVSLSPKSLGFRIESPQGLVLRELGLRKLIGSQRICDLINWNPSRIIRITVRAPSVLLVHVDRF
jgi:hypothetical protein